MTKIESLEKDLKQTKQTMGNAIVKLVKKVKKWRLDVKIVKTGLEDVSTGFEDVSTVTDINSASEKVSLVVNMGEELKDRMNWCKKIARGSLELLKSKEKNGSSERGCLSFIQKSLGHNWAKLEARQIWSKEIAGEDIKKLTNEELKEKFEYLMRSMERFVPMDTEKESRKRTGVELQTESSKKLKSDTREDVSVPKAKDKESKKPESGTEEDVEAYMEERVDEPSSEEFPMSSIPQGPAPAKIVKWQIIKTGKRGAYQIIREDNTDVVYVNFQGLLNDLTRDDLKELYRLMMLKYGDNRPEEEFERVLWGDLKTMFDPPSEEDAIWKLPHQQQILNWRYFHSCSVHCLTVEAAHIYMLTEVKYPLPPRVCKAMLEKKLLAVSTMSNRHKDWLVQEQTALGKDFSNPFMADNLPKIVWLSTHHIYVCKELASPQGYGLCMFHVLRVEMVINVPWFINQTLATPGLMANWKIIMLQFKNNSKDNAYKILRKLIMKDFKKLEVHSEESKLGDGC
ncbi:hypothetical protein Tco_0804015 [Tanacetum coccineum]|uniref:Uncharacterized protein n=1 Tax=Tanacetum coccineum TaxID=301880 RepID=A0ABQ5A795_9ASTR